MKTVMGERRGQQLGIVEAPMSDREKHCIETEHIGSDCEGDVTIDLDMKKLNGLAEPLQPESSSQCRWDNE